MMINTAIESVKSQENSDIDGGSGEESAIENGEETTLLPTILESSRKRKRDDSPEEGVKRPRVEPNNALEESSADRRAKFERTVYSKACLLILAAKKRALEQQNNVHNLH